MRMLRWGLGLSGLAVAGAVVVGALGLGVGAQAEEGEKSGVRALYLDLVAEKLGVTVEDFQAAQEAARGEAIEQAVASPGLSALSRVSGSGTRKQVLAGTTGADAWATRSRTFLELLPP